MEELVAHLIERGVLGTPRIIGAFRKVDRKDFVPEKYKPLAYEDTALPIGFGQTISQPYTVAFMLELLDPRPGDQVLDVGSGSGWQSALLAHMVGKKGSVTAIELVPELKTFGENSLKKYPELSRRVEFVAGNALEKILGHPQFNRIIAAASGNKVPGIWKKELAAGGRIVAPVGDSIHLLEKEGVENFREEIFPGFVFVPLVEN